MLIVAVGEGLGVGAWRACSFVAEALRLDCGASNTALRATAARTTMKFFKESPVFMVAWRLNDGLTRLVTGPRTAA